jgi:hypothetical protein
MSTPHSRFVEMLIRELVDVGRMPDRDRPDLATVRGREIRERDFADYQTAALQF